MTPLFLHIGYPKTATSTFQRWAFPHHSQLNYLGKQIPSMRFVEEGFYDRITDIITRPSHIYRAQTDFRDGVNRLRESRAKATLISSENFLHPEAVDIRLVAERFRDLFPDAKIIITIREQISLITSHMSSSGRFGRYLWLLRDVAAGEISFPISADDWMQIQLHSFGRSFLATLHFHEVWCAYREIFGADRVGLFVFEQLRDDPRAYCQDLAGYLNIDSRELLSLIDNRRENTSGDGGGDSGVNGEGASSFTPAQIDRLKALYGAGNARLAKASGLPLAKYGYVIEE